jgi:hypothetical protein
LFGFKYNLAEEKAGEQKRDYMQGEGGQLARWWGGLKGALSSLQFINSTGPKSLNGGEVVVSADGECEYIWRMQNTVDHTNVEDLAKVLGAKFDGFKDGEVEKCGEVCEVKS